MEIKKNKMCIQCKKKEANYGFFCEFNCQREYRKIKNEE